MKLSSSNYLILAALPILFILSGCASYGKLSITPRNETDALLADLLSQTDRYVVHYHGNSEKLVSGILFDPKDNPRTIRPEGALWNEVSDPETIAAIHYYAVGDGRIATRLALVCIPIQVDRSEESTIRTGPYEGTFAPLVTKPDPDGSNGTIDQGGKSQVLFG